jgi:hypothetical protein
LIIGGHFFFLRTSPQTNLMIIPSSPTFIRSEKKINAVLLLLWLNKTVQRTSLDMI